MHSINKNEINRLELWAEQENSGVSFERNISSANDSFWKSREGDRTYITEYGFTTVPEFEMLCANILEHEFDSQIKKVISVSMIKNTPREKFEKEENRDAETLPEYIYMF